MAKREREEPASRQSTPTQFAETTPPAYPSTDFSFTVQGIYDLKGSVSKLEQTIVHLTDEVRDQHRDIKVIQRTIWVASGAIIVLWAIGGLLFNRAWDTMVQVNDFLRHPPPAQSTPIQPPR